MPYLRKYYAYKESEIASYCKEAGDIIEFLFTFLKKPDEGRFYAKERIFMGKLLIELATKRISYLKTDEDLMAAKKSAEVGYKMVYDQAFYNLATSDVNKMRIVVQYTTF